MRIKINLATLSLARNIGNTDIVQKYLSTLIGDDVRLNAWINGNLRKYIINQHSSITPHRSDVNDPQWLRNSKEPIVDVIITSELKRNVEHALDYLKTVRTDLSRIPVADAIRLANAAIDEENSKASGGEDVHGIELMHKFVDGFTIVNVISKKSLQREGKLMDHCVGSKGKPYIELVKEGATQIWSLRDQSNTPHATIEYSVKDKRINQIKGESNGKVEPQYTPYLREFLSLNTIIKIVDSYEEEEAINIGMLFINDKWRDPYRLPENFKVRQDLNLYPTKVTYLPKGLKVFGDLDISETSFKELPDGLQVRGALNASFTLISKLPDGLKVGKSLNIIGTEITSLPKKLVVGGNLLMTYARITELPDDLKVGGSLSLEKSHIAALPKGLKVNISLFINHTNIKELPAGLHVVKDLYLSHTPITSLPYDLVVGRNLIITGTDIQDIPATVKIGGKIIR